MARPLWRVMLGIRLSFTFRRSLAVSFMTLFTTIGFAEAFGVYEDFFVRTGVASASQISWVGSVQGLCAYLADRKSVV